ncbi:MAG: SIR2 family protein [Bacteroidota bacterium]
MKEKLILFTAAGFSIDFLEPKTESKEKLTTDFITKVITDYSFFKDEVFDCIKEQLGNKLDKESYLNDCKAIINKYSELYEIAKNELGVEDTKNLNFEHLIYLSELISDTKKGELKGTILIEHKLKPIVLSNKFDNPDFTLNETLKIKALILNVIYAYFKLRSNESDVLQSYFKKICSIYEFKYHTLNYDLVIENSINDFRKNTERDNNDNKNYYFNHLHGQIDLVSAKYLIGAEPAFNHRAGSMNSIVKEIGTGNFDSHENRHDFDMITGFDKSTKMLNDHYNKAYNKFVLDYHTSNEIIIIGYSFNDKHINNILRANIRNYKKVIIVDYLKLEERTNDEIFRKIYFIFLQIWDNYLNYTSVNSDKLKNLIYHSEITNIYYHKEEEVEFEFHFDGCISFIKSQLNN